MTNLSEIIEAQIAELKQDSEARFQVAVESLTYYKAGYEVQKDRNRILEEILREIKLLRATGTG